MQVFSVKSIEGSNKAKILYVRDAEQDNEFGYVSDTVIENIDLDHHLIGRFYKCNMSGSYLMTTKKLPVYSLSVILERPLQDVQLLSLNLFFHIDSNIETSNELLHKKIVGHYTIELLMSGEIIVLDNLDKFPGETNLFNKMKMFIMTNEIKEIINNLKELALKKIIEQESQNKKKFVIPTNIKSLQDYEV